VQKIVENHSIKIYQLLQHQFYYTYSKILTVPKNPFCGVEITSVGGEPGKVREFHHKHAPGPGVFMEEIIKELKKRNVRFEIEDAGK